MQTKAVEESDSRIKWMKPLRTPHIQFGILGHIETVFYIFLFFFATQNLDVSRLSQGCLLDSDFFFFF